MAIAEDIRQGVLCVGPRCPPAYEKRSRVRLTRFKNHERCGAGSWGRLVSHQSGRWHRHVAAYPGPLRDPRGVAEVGRPESGINLRICAHSHCHRWPSLPRRPRYSPVAMRPFRARPRTPLRTSRRADVHPIYFIYRIGGRSPWSVFRALDTSTGGIVIIKVLDLGEAKPEVREDVLKGVHVHARLGENRSRTRRDGRETAGVLHGGVWSATPHIALSTVPRRPPPHAPTLPITCAPHTSFPHFPITPVPRRPPPHRPTLPPSPICPADHPYIAPLWLAFREGDLLVLLMPEARGSLRKLFGNVCRDEMSVAKVREWEGWMLVVVIVREMSVAKVREWRERGVGSGDSEDGQERCWWRR